MPAPITTTIFMNQVKHDLNRIYICFYKCIQFPLMHFHHFSDTAQSDLIPLRGRRIFFDLIMKRAPDPAPLRVHIHRNPTFLIPVL